MRITTILLGLGAALLFATSAGAQAAPGAATWNDNLSTDAAYTYTGNTCTSVSGGVCFFRSGDYNGTSPVSTALKVVSQGGANLTLHTKLGSAPGAGTCTAQVVFSDVDPQWWTNAAAIYPVVVGGGSSLMEAANPSFWVPQGWVWLEIGSGSVSHACMVSIRGI